MCSAHFRKVHSALLKNYTVHLPNMHHIADTAQFNLHSTQLKFVQCTFSKVAPPSPAPPTSTNPQANIDPNTHLIPAQHHPHLLTQKQAKAITDLLEQATKDHDCSGLNSIINLFRRNSSPKFTAAMHCEAILASIMKYPDLVNCDSGFRVKSSHPHESFPQTNVYVFNTEVEYQDNRYF